MVILQNKGLELESTLWKMELPMQQNVTPLRGGGWLALMNQGGFPLSLSHIIISIWLPHTRGPNVTINMKSNNARPLQDNTLCVSIVTETHMIAK